MATLKPLACAFLTATCLVGCSLINSTPKNDLVLNATNNEQGYYNEAKNALANEQYSDAIKALNNLRTFYPTGIYAKQALLDLIYAHYQADDLEAVTKTTNQFLQRYSTSPEAAYALYAQGVVNMQGSPKSSQLIPLDQSERDTAYLRLAFDDFSKLISYFPNSPYSSDAALRMTHIYNQFAHHELNVAYWYIKREAYVAAANRAKWVFQYYPQSTAIPEAIAILAFSYEQLGLGDTAEQYKTLLQINYPNYLNNGQVILPKANTSLLGQALSLSSFGTLGKPNPITDTGNRTYQGATRPQRILSAQSLRLPRPNPQANPAPSSSQPIDTQLGLGLPERTNNPASIQPITDMQ